MIKIPQKLIFIDGSFALDGGSTYLEAVDPSGNNVSISLDWSIESQEKGTCQLFYNEYKVHKRSEEEKLLLDLFSNASYQASDDSVEEQNSNSNSNQIILGDDIQNIFDGINNSPSAGLQAMVNELIKKVNSDNYLNAVKF